MIGRTEEPAVERVAPNDPLWTELLAHLDRVDQRRHAFGPDGAPHDGSHFLVVRAAERIVGNIGLQEKLLSAPETPTSAGVDLIMRDAGGRPLRELYVQSFAVELDFRRRGFGRTLQLAALALASELGCHQLRSWSTVDKIENYALKLSLGFAADPAVYHSETTGQDYSGVYFVKAVR
jgi:GNAT superfamily N-acetyltransferase